MLRLDKVTCEQFAACLNQDFETAIPSAKTVEAGGQRDDSEIVLIAAHRAAAIGAALDAGEFRRRGVPQLAAAADPQLRAGCIASFSQDEPVRRPGR